MKKKFKILERGNFYFPFLDKGKEFLVEDTIDVKINKKYNKLLQICFKFKDRLFLGELAEPIWEALNEIELEQYRHCWFVPVYLHKLGNEYVCSIDILKKVK